MPELRVSCLCGTFNQFLSTEPSAAGPSGLSICHCDACRHITGLLCTSYQPITSSPWAAGLRMYKSSPDTTRFFCATCGCHVFRVRRTGNQAEWAVATGTIVSEKDGVGDAGGSHGRSLQFARNINVGATSDGGLSVWLREVDGIVLETEQGGAPGARQEEDSDGDVLPAHCLCGQVRFHITRPDEDLSRRPRSQFPDLMIPYCQGSPEIANPDDVKWWLRPPREGAEIPSGSRSRGNGRGRYLAGTCACRSCRLTSGFEIQTWAFVPRANIFLRLTPSSGRNGTATASTVPLDLENIPPAKLTEKVLTSYASSEGVVREFCGVCGATVFWHNAERPELVDVSAGLFSAGGARAESWLDWWRRRVSFAEEAGLDREGSIQDRARRLIEGLEKGLQSI